MRYGFGYAVVAVGSIYRSLVPPQTTESGRTPIECEIKAVIAREVGKRPDHIHFFDTFQRLGYTELRMQQLRREVGKIVDRHSRGRRQVSEGDTRDWETVGDCIDYVNGAVGGV